MHKILCFSLLLLTGGCVSATDLLTLSPTEAAELVARVDTTLQSQQEFTKFTHSVARGEADLAGYTYDPPTAENGWVGSVSATSATFPFGIGDFSMTFTAIGDGGPVDPYVTDITDDTMVSVTVSAGFLGTQQSLPIEITALFDGESQQNAVDGYVSRVNGDFDIEYDGYIAEIDAVDVDVTVDTVTDEITSIVGELDASIDIPAFAFDADLDVQGLGDELDIGIQVAGTTLDYLLTLADLF